jgi:hypothetical protein
MGDMATLDVIAVVAILIVFTYWQFVTKIYP